MEAKQSNEHVDFWTKLWDNATKNSVTPGFHMSKIHPVLLENGEKLFENTDEQKSIFVPLCGKALDLIHLAKFGQVSGVEVSQLAIDQFSEENNLKYDEIILKESNGTKFQTKSGENDILIGKYDFFNLPTDWSPFNGKFTAAFDRASLVAIKPELRESYAKVIADQMAPNGKVLLVSFAYDQNRMSGPPFSVPEETVKALFHESFEIEKVHERDIREFFSKNQDHEYFLEQSYIMTRKA